MFVNTYLTKLDLEKKCLHFINETCVHKLLKNI